MLDVEEAECDFVVERVPINIHANDFTSFVRIRLVQVRMEPRFSYRGLTRTHGKSSLARESNRKYEVALNLKRSLTSWYCSVKNQ